MARNGKTSPWVYLGIGCGVVAALIVAGLGIAVWWFNKGIERQVERQKDPAHREARVLDVLGAERIPDGYYASMAFEIPFLMEVALLSDAPPPIDAVEGEPPRVEERGLIYFKLLVPVAEGKQPSSAFEPPIDIELGEVVGRGEIMLPGVQRAGYVVQRGSIARDNAESMATLTSTVTFACPGDSGTGSATWFEPDPAPAAAAEALELEGTVGDPAELAGFLGQFRFCG